jgi:hypothetical protein
MCLVLFSNLQYDFVGWAPKEYNPDDKQSNGPEQPGTDVGAPQSGFVWDEASGYYYDATSGFYYDGNTGMFLCQVYPKSLYLGTCLTFPKALLGYVSSIMYFQSNSMYFWFLKTFVILFELFK